MPGRGEEEERGDGISTGTAHLEETERYLHVVRGFLDRIEGKLGA
jgi:hypothetical protein